MIPGTTSLRPEATPLPYHTLFAVQQDAYRQLAAMLAQAVNERRHPGTEPPLTGFNLDLDRKARVAVVSGERGTGKTSAVLSLIHDVLTRRGPAFGTTDANDTAVQETTRKNVESLFGRVVWLEMLDMSPLPASANLFSAILVRLEDAAGRLLPQALAEERPRSYLDPPERYDSPLEKLRRLQTDVAVSWEGNLRERSGALDPSAFAAEVRRAEHVRLKLNDRLAEVLDGLAAEVSRRAGQPSDVLFVLPIDDFDLNPPRCLELLELLRTLSVPRLFYVVLGDVDVAEVMCGLQLAADVARVAGGAAEAELLPVHRHDVQATVANVAGNVIRKLLPPSQRVYLAALRVEQTVNLRPPGKSPSDRSIADWLKQVPFDFPDLDSQISRRFPISDEENLYEFLFAGDPKPFYHARRFLQMPLRQLVDFWLTLERTGSDPQGDRLEVFRRRLHVFCRDVVHAEQTLPPEARRRFRTAFDLEPDVNWAVSMEPFQLKPVMYPSRVEVPSQSATVAKVSLEWTNRVRGTTGWEFRTNPQGEESSPLSLTPTTVALLIFYTDLVTLARGNGEPNPVFNVTPSCYRFASTEYRFQGRGLHWLSWPFPPVLTFWEADKFLDAWTKWLRRVEGDMKSGPQSPDPTPSLVYHWISLGTEVLTGKEQLKTLTSLYSITQNDWQTLKSDVESLYSQSSLSPRIRSAVHVWVNQVLSLLNEDVLGADDLPRQAFRQSPQLKGLCQREGKRLAEWNESYLRRAKVFEGIDDSAFWTALRQFPEWWKEG